MVGRDDAGTGSRGAAPRNETVRRHTSGATNKHGPEHEPPRFEVIALSTADRRACDVSLQVAAGEIVGVYGLVGSGRSEFAQAVFGLRAIADGALAIDGRPVAIRNPQQAVAFGMAYVPEDRLREGLFGGLSLRANLVISSLRALGGAVFASRAQEQRTANGQVAALAIRCRDIEQPIAELSGGNQQKAVLARWLVSRPAVLVLDEPTRGVDVTSKTEIYRVLRDEAARGAAVLFISSDLSEVMANSDRVVVFRQGRKSGEFRPSETTAEQIAGAALPAEGAAEGAALARRKRRRPWRSEVALALANLAVIAMLGFSSDAFFTAENLTGLLASASVWTILSLGAAAVILCGAIDISLGSLLALSAGVGGLVLALPYSPLVTIPAGVAAALAVGIAGGIANASLSLWGRVHPIVVTLGAMTVYRGLLISLSGGHTITDLPEAFVRWPASRIVGLSGSGVLAGVVVVAAYIWLNRLRSGRYVMALGASPTAARLVGISKARTWLTAFAAGGLLAAVAGLLELAQTGSLQSGTGVGYELQAIAAAVIGGVSITGGRGSVLGVCLGALLLSLIYNGLVLWEVSRYQYSLLTGGLLLLAVLADLAWRRLER
jgi:ribose/xylose/arabinose/galactoside ABC-type transport system permease subunit/ABC-type Mn2+/Zn2+ transport system ATPase subunit